MVSQRTCTMEHEDTIKHISLSSLKRVEHISFEQYCSISKKIGLINQNFFETFHKTKNQARVHTLEPRFVSTPHPSHSQLLIVSPSHRSILLSPWTRAHFLGTSSYLTPETHCQCRCYVTHTFLLLNCFLSFHFPLLLSDGCRVKNNGSTLFPRSRTFPSLVIMAATSRRRPQVLVEKVLSTRFEQ